MMKILPKRSTGVKKQRNGRAAPGATGGVRSEASCPAAILGHLEGGEAGHEGRGAVCPTVPPRSRPPKTRVAADPGGHEPERRPARALACGEPFFVVLDIDEHHLVANGIIPVEGDVVRGTLSLDPQDRLVRLDVCLGPASDGQVPALSELNQRTRLTRGWRDREDRVAWLRSESACCGDATAATCAVAHAMWRTLQDPVVLDILDESASSDKPRDTGMRGVA